MLWPNGSNMEQWLADVGNLDTEPTTQLVTFPGGNGSNPDAANAEAVGIKRSVTKEAQRGSSGLLVLHATHKTPVNQDGKPLPFFAMGRLIIPLDGNPEFAWWTTELAANAFGLRDIMRYADVPPAIWDKLGQDPEEYPECRGCEHAVPAPGCTNGAQITCQKNFRFGRFVACMPVCRWRKKEIGKGITSLPPAQIAAVQAEKKEHEDRIAQRESVVAAKAENEGKGKRLKRGKVLPLRRADVAPTPLLNGHHDAEPEPPKPREGEPPAPRQKRTLAQPKASE